MKRFKISAVLLSTCLALGALAGCSQSSASPAKSDGTVANINGNFRTNVSEGVASEISEVVYDDADVLTSGKPAAPADGTDTHGADTRGADTHGADTHGADTRGAIEDEDSTAPAADENVDPDAARQIYANAFVSAFAEQNISEIDIYKVSNEELTDFVRIFLKFHSTDLISYEPKGEMLFETFELSTAHDVIKDFFGVFITDAFTDRFAAPPEGHGDQPAGPFFEDNKIWYEAYDIEFSNRFAVVDSFTSNEDGTMTLTFTVYEAGPDADLTECYRLTPEKAAADSTLNIVTKGSAIVSVGQSGAYYMNSYKTA